MKKMTIPGIQNKSSAKNKALSVESSGRFVHGLIFSIIVIALLAIVSIKLMNPMTLPIKQVSINGDFNHLSPVSLQERASSVVRGGFFNVNVETIQEALSEEPWVKEILVRRIWPDRILVDIKEQQAVAKWGDNGLINQEAFIFYPEISTFPENLPYLSGPDNSAGMLLEYLEQFRKIIPETIVVKELHLSNRRSWELILDNDLVLQFGKVDVLEKARQFFQYYSGIHNKTEREINYVDLRYTNGFVIGWQAVNESEMKNGQEKNGKKI